VVGLGRELLADILAINELVSFRIVHYDPKYPALKLDKPRIDQELNYN